jgi:hypothetical protein
VRGGEAGWGAVVVADMAGRALPCGASDRSAQLLDQAPYHVEHLRLGVAGGVAEPPAQAAPAAP